MSEHGVDAQIETLKELWVTDSDLSYLREIDPSVLTRVVQEVKAHAERTSAGQAVLFESIAKTTRFVPNFVLAKLGAGLSPYVLARISEHLEPKAAAALSKSFEPALLAEVSLQLSAALTAQIAVHADVEMLSVITEVLGRRGLSRRLGEISDLLDEQMLAKVTERIRDPERLASVAAHMTRFDKLSRIGQRLDAKMRKAVISVLERQGHSNAAAVLEH